jgi:hypothetical protein
MASTAPADTAHHAREFKRRRQRQLLLLLPVGAALLVFQDRGSGLVPSEIAAGALLAVVASGLAFTLYNWRCPACRRYLGRRLFLRRCPRCDVGFV